MFLCEPQGSRKVLSCHRANACERSLLCLKGSLSIMRRVLCYPTELSLSVGISTQPGSLTALLHCSGLWIQHM